MSSNSCGIPLQGRDNSRRFGTSVACLPWWSGTGFCAQAQHVSICSSPGFYPWAQHV